MNNRRPSSFHFTMPPDIAGQVHAYKDAMRFDSITQTVEMLVRMALAATPEAGVTQLAYSHARSEYEKWIRQRVAQFFVEMQIQTTG